MKYLIFYYGFYFPPRSNMNLLLLYLNTGKIQEYRTLDLEDNKKLLTKFIRELDNSTFTILVPEINLPIPIGPFLTSKV